MQFAAEQQHLLEDQAFLLESRGVVCLCGEQAVQALQPLLIHSLARVASRPVLAYMLDDEGLLLADLFVVSHEDVLLIECEKSFVSSLLELLESGCEKLDVTARDISGEWRVFAELPDQNTYDDGTPFIKYADPRWHMGARVLRPVSAAISSQWGSEIKWTAHAFKLGFLPCAELVRHKPVTPLEAGLHAVGGIDADRLPPYLRADLSALPETLTWRVLPMRIEPDALSFPTMVGSPVTAGEAEIGKVIGHNGLYALVHVELQPWRSALEAGHPLLCAGQAVVITWPSWLAQESLGRGGPVAIGD